jgi:hypothetical protein
MSVSGRRWINIIFGIVLVLGSLPCAASAQNDHADGEEITATELANGLPRFATKLADSNDLAVDTAFFATNQTHRTICVDVTLVVPQAFGDTSNFFWTTSPAVYLRGRQLPIAAVLPPKPLHQADCTIVVPPNQIADPTQGGNVEDCATSAHHQQGLWVREGLVANETTWSCSACLWNLPAGTLFAVWPSLTPTDTVAGENSTPEEAMARVPFSVMRTQTITQRSHVALCDNIAVTVAATRQQHAVHVTISAVPDYASVWVWNDWTRETLRLSTETSTDVILPLAGLPPAAQAITLTFLQPTAPIDCYPATMRVALGGDAITLWGEEGVAVAVHEYVSRSAHFRLDDPKAKRGEGGGGGGATWLRDTLGGGYSDQCHVTRALGVFGPMCLLSILWVQMFAIFFIDPPVSNTAVTAPSSWHAVGRGVLTAASFVLGAEVRPSAAINFGLVALLVGLIGCGGRALSLASCHQAKFRLPGAVSLGHIRGSVVFVIGFVLCLLPLHTC